LILKSVATRQPLMVLKLEDVFRQCCTHRVIEIGIGEATVQLQARNNPLNEDAALLYR
jgi:hypothetical protein